MDRMAGRPDKPRFALCIRNDECDDLETRKVYRVLPGDAAAEDDLRVIDGSAEDCLYPASHSILLDLPQHPQEALAAAE